MSGGKTSRAPRVAFVNTHPIQYFAPLYRYINQAGRIEAVPIYLSDYSLRGEVDKGFGQKVTWDIDLLSGTEPVFAKGSETRTIDGGLTKIVAPDVWRLIRTGGYDAVVVHGHNIAANHIAWAAAKSVGIPVFTRGEMHLGLERSARRTWMRDRLLPLLYARYDGVLAIGTANQEFYRYMNVADRKISLFPYTVDNDRLMSASRLSPEARTAMRARIGITGDAPAVLYCSKFMPRKHPDDLIRACAQLVSEGHKLELVLAGSGEMDSQLRALAATYPALKVHFPGFFNQSELPVLFGACDLFVLPSRNEPWGLIINEAMCAGLPVVASREIGSVRDLVHQDVNGAIFDARDVPGLAAAMRPIVSDTALRTRMGQASIDIISKWSYRECEAGLADALQKAGVVVAARDHG